MPSITYWNRLEPRSRSNDLANALAARVRDPAWFLARQWQLGEFKGEDAASPAYVRVHATITPFEAVEVPGAPPTLELLDGRMPIERAIGAEPFSPDDLSLAVELGRWFEMGLPYVGLEDTLQDWRDAYPIDDVPDEDPRAARLRRLWKGRVVNGIALYLAGREPAQPPPVPPPGVPPTIDQSDWTNASFAVQFLVNLAAGRVWAPASQEVIGAADPATWRPDRLDYAARVFASVEKVPNTPEIATLEAHPDQDGDLEWFAFDEIIEPPPQGLTPNVEIVERTVIPGRVRFRGMPSERFWDFEDGRVDFGGLLPDRRDLASMMLMEFMLVHGTDWYLVPFEQPHGTLCKAKLTVVDVFGGEHDVVRAEEIDAGQAGEKQWTMFSTSAPEAAAGYFLLPRTAAAVVEEGPVLEDVRFLRDETANLAWAIEHATEGSLGTPWLGHERAVGPAPAADEVFAAAPLKYRLQSRVPAHWIPFQAVRAEPASDQILLEKAALLGPEGNFNPLPRGKVLSPSGMNSEERYRIREEEIPREGRRIARVVRRARHGDGSYLWVARKRGIGAGEGWSGLRYDHALLADKVEPLEPPEPRPSLEWDQPPGWDDADWT